MAPFSMQELHEEDCARLAVAGELDLVTADAFAHRVRCLCADGSKLLVDLSAVEFMDSRALRVVEETINDVRRGHGEIALAPVLAPQVSRLFELLNVQLSPSLL